ncbi:BadF/BadG/BcrA/BcrD ATPase family protein [Janthinobacterium sp.]
MIEYIIGVDGGGSGTRVRLARLDGHELAQGQSGPSGLGLGIERAWTSVAHAVTLAFRAAGLEQPPLQRMAIGLGLAGVHNKQWAASFIEHNPGYAAVALESDALTTLLGAHAGQPGAIVAIGTGSVGEVLHADGSRHEVGGWGFPSGDEAGGAWIGMRAINHV